jgi:uncharacterized protein YodC (DUF2158 family)
MSPIKNRDRLDTDASQLRLATLKRCLAIASVTAVLVSGLNAKWIGPMMAAPAASQAEEQSVHAPALRTGDLVRLRSGGSLVTVNNVEGDQATCFWSTDEGNVQTGSFAIAELTAPITMPAADLR